MKLCLACKRSFADASWVCPQCRYAPLASNGILSFVPQSLGDNQGFREELFAELFRLEANNFWFRSRNKLILQMIKNCFPNFKSFMELGCGTGYVLTGIAAAFPHVRISGSDISCEGLVFAKTRLPQARLLQLDARHLPYVDEFDVLGAFDVLEHIAEDEAVLGQMRQAVRPGGGIIITVPQHPWLWSNVDKAACHVRRYTQAAVISKVEQAGFRVEKTVSFVSLLLPLMFLSRCLHKSSCIPNPQAELTINGLLNAVFGKVMSVERFLTRKGMHLPFGGSLLVVARKR